MNIELTYTPQQNEIFFNNEEGIRYVIVPKGRRFGATQGSMHACIDWCLDGNAILWGDTINSNIDRYFERYCKPMLVRNKIEYKWSGQQKKLIIGKGYIDFRSADRPENWEGFGYDKIILNEAGIILKNDYLYTNVVLPMMIDNPDSILFALGVPKGKTKKDGKEHQYYKLYLKALNNEKGYRLLQFTSYDNPLLDPENIKELEDEISGMSPIMVEQEIYGKFVDQVMDSLWSPELFKRKSSLPELKRKVIAIDPAVTKNLDSDETGIISAGIDYANNLYFFKDSTGKYSPNQWATIALNDMKINDGDAIVAEVNQGGDMVETIIRQYDKVVRVIKVRASKGKEVRAEPLVSMYEQGKVFHVGNMSKLENEQLTWVPGQGKSPNRIDAAVWAATELLKLQTNTNQWA